jgi:hypothetical protein
VEIMRTFNFKGFPDRISSKVEVPGIAELLFGQFFARTDADHFYKHSSAAQRKMLESCDIMGGYKHITVDYYVQLLYPKSCSINVRMNRGFLNEWHFDGHGESGQSTFHLLQNESSANTVFNTEPFSIDIKDDSNYWDLLYLLNSEADKLIKPKKMPSNRFVTFTDHLHNSVSPKEREFRFFMRVTESDDIIPRGADEGHGLIAGVPIDFIEDGKVVKVQSVLKNENNIILNNHSRLGGL